MFLCKVIAPIESNHSFQAVDLINVDEVAIDSVVYLRMRQKAGFISNDKAYRTSLSSRHGVVELKRTPLTPFQSLSIPGLSANQFSTSTDGVDNDEELGPPTFQPWKPVFPALFNSASQPPSGTGTQTGRRTGMGEGARKTEGGRGSERDIKRST